MGQKNAAMDLINSVTGADEEGRSRQRILAFAAKRYSHIAWISIIHRFRWVSFIRYMTRVCSSVGMSSLLQLATLRLWIQFMLPIS